jgi:hypothetical protein
MDIVYIGKCRCEIQERKEVLSVIYRLISSTAYYP